MAKKKLTIRLTDGQQKQIRDVTGKNVTELSFDLDQLSEKDLDKVAGGISVVVDKASPV